MKTFVEQASRVNTLTDQVNHMLERVLMFLKQLPRTFVHWNECIHPRWQLSLLTSGFPTVHWNGYPYSSIFLKPNSAHLYIKLNYIRTWERVFTFLNSCPVVDGLTPSPTWSLIYPRWAVFLLQPRCHSLWSTAFIYWGVFWIHQRNTTPTWLNHHNH